MLRRRLNVHSAAIGSARGIRNVSPKPTVVVIGTGWGGARCVKNIDPKLCNMAVLSQRNHMVFTPLLPQTCTGTLEFRSICEPIVRVQPALAHEPNVFLRTMVYDVDFQNQYVKCMTVGVLGSSEQVPVRPFNFHYDYLVLGHGARPNTFNIPGVEDHAFFLREISEARGIRKRLIQNLMTARLPTTSPEERQRLLHVVVVGGGPTGVEFAGDLADFLAEDIPKIAPGLGAEFRMTLVEANEILGTFDLNLRNYGAKRLQAMRVHLKKAIVAEVTDSSVVLTDGEVLQSNLVVWSTGVGPSSLNKALDCDKTKQGRLSVDSRMRVLVRGRPMDNVFAVGDCAADMVTPLPTLAAVAQRQGKYVAKNLNLLLSSPTKTVDSLPAFTYKHLGSMASLGHHAALVDLKPSTGLDFKGIKAFLVWRSAYFTMLGSVRSRLYVFVNWCGSVIWGRDVTYISEISEAKLWKNLAIGGVTKEQVRLRTLKEAAMRPTTSVTLGTEGVSTSVTDSQAAVDTSIKTGQNVKAVEAAKEDKTPVA
jgi:NADH dehydrogenase FAD-containing subunit